MIRRGLLLLMLGGVSPAAAQSDPPHTGPLPPGALATLRFAGVRDEIGFQFPVPVEALEGKLPPGYRHVPFSAVRTATPRLDAALTATPAAGEMALGIIAWASLDTAAINGRPSRGDPVLLAFVWIPLQRTDATLDRRIPPSAVPMVELGFWSSPGDFAEHLGGRRPQTEPAEITWSKRDAVHSLSLRTRDGVRVDAECTPQGQGTSDSRGTPFYQVVYAPGPSRVFTILTGGGHRIRPCGPGALRAVGPASWTRGAGLLDPEVFPGVHEDSWTARGAVYAPEIR